MPKLCLSFVGALLLGGCAVSPNSLRDYAGVDGPWIASVTSADCAIKQTFGVDIAGRAFGFRVPQTKILLSGVIRDGGVRTEYSQQGKGYASAEISETDIAFETPNLARGTWRSAQCRGEVTLRRRGPA